MSAEQGVSFIVPVHNGEAWLQEVLDAILAQGDGRPLEILAVDDGSTDGSPAILARYAEAGQLRVLHGPRRGAAAASNLGLRQARYPLVCQVDQDVVLQPGWMEHLLDALAQEGVAAAQGYYVTDPRGSVWARVMGYDLELRYSKIRAAYMDHVCTGNTAYRAAALQQVGLFDETLGYGYDNDMSYRLGAAGYRLAFVRQARSIHRWRQGLWSYLRQQYGVGYGRLDLVHKHRGPRVKGDDVSGLRMILHVPAMLLCLFLLAVALATAALGGPAHLPVALGGGLLGLLALDRLVAGVEALLRFRKLSCLAMVPAHLLRDLVWVLALMVWLVRRLDGRPPRPSDSMLR